MTLGSPFMVLYCGQRGLLTQSRQVHGDLESVAAAQRFQKLRQASAAVSPFAKGEVDLAGWNDRVDISGPHPVDRGEPLPGHWKIALGLSRLSEPSKPIFVRPRAVTARSIETV